MFTGIIEALCPVVGFKPMAESAMLSVDLGALAQDAKPGDSICVDGVCLTVSRIEATVTTFDVATETLGRTTLADCAAGRKLNVERSLRLSDRLGGHFVLGHVDGVGAISKMEKAPGQTLMHVRVAADLSAMMIPKGSVALDGISLTIVEATPSGFSVALIPTTLEMTTLGFKGAGDAVNVEGDIIGKWVKKLMGQGSAGDPGGLNMDQLRKAGFA